MGDLADSKRNMKIDFRPRVVMRVMRLELIVALFSISMCVGMPLYFLKFKGYKDDLMEQAEKKRQAELEAAREQARLTEQSALRRLKE